VKWRIVGPEDVTGDTVENERLSLVRADAPQALLVKAGTLADRITTRRFGSEEPVASNRTPESRAKNRRIEVPLG
jgi:outer membrane protein OmpA-like peptidoglycan-associated protein